MQRGVSLVIRMAGATQTTLAGYGGRSRLGYFGGFLGIDLCDDLHSLEITGVLVVRPFVNNVWNAYRSGTSWSGGSLLDNIPKLWLNFNRGYKC